MRTWLAIALTWLALAGTWITAQEPTILDTEPGSGTNQPVSDAAAVTFQTLSDDQALSESHKRRYLESNGWAYNCDNPGSVWLWAKVLDGKEYRLELEIATYIQVQSESQ